MMPPPGLWSHAPCLLFHSDTLIAAVPLFPPSPSPNMQYSHEFYLMSTASEWVLCTSFLMYFITFHNEFNQILMTVRVGRRGQTAEIAIRELGEDTPLAS